MFIFIFIILVAVIHYLTNKVLGISSNNSLSYTYSKRDTGIIHTIILSYKYYFTKSSA